MKRLRSRAVLIATTLAFVLVTTGVIAVFFATPAQAHSSTVTVLDGSVLVRHAGGQFAPITDGDIVGSGDTVRTAVASHGVLTFFDGTTVELEPDTEITIDQLRASASGDKVVEITQTIGRTWHVVAKLVSPSSKYEIRTPASTAAVRGTAFQVAVSAEGTTSTETTEGDVSTIAQGAEVHVLPGQINSVTQGSPPQPPQPAPEPGATVRITVDLTQNAVVTDANGRAVGVQNGLPVRYIPGSKVEIIGGKLVVTIPNTQLGVLSTFIKPDAAPFGGSAPTSVTVQTEVSVKDVGVVANSLTTRPVENGTAKGAVVVTGTGLLLVPNSDARNAPAPHIGRAPAGPTGILPIFSAPSIAPLVTAAPATLPPTTITTDTPKALDMTTAAFLPFRSTATTASTPSVNTGVIAITTPIDTVFKTTPITTVGGTAATPTPAPVFTLSPSITIPSTTIGDGTTRDLTVPTTVFATPTPAPVLQIVTTPIAPRLELAPTPTPAPTVGGFLPKVDNLIPALPTATPIPTPAPTPVPTILKLVSPPVFEIAPTVAPTLAPTLAPVLKTISPIVVITAAPTPAPTLAPTLAPIILRTIAPITITPTATPAPTVAPFTPRPVLCTFIC